MQRSVTRVSAATGISDHLLMQYFVFSHSSFDPCLFVAADAVLSCYLIKA